jgi:hypothetical protein
VLKVTLFGATSIQTNKANTGPKPAGVKWDLSEVTPGAIALAAILVSTPLYQRILSRIIDTSNRFDSCCPQMKIFRLLAPRAGSNMQNPSRRTRPRWSNTATPKSARGSSPNSITISSVRSQTPRTRSFLTMVITMPKSRSLKTLFSQIHPMRISSTREFPWT